MNKHQKLIEFLGGQTAVAKLLDISPQAVNKWSGEIPSGRLAELAIATGRQPASLESLNDVSSVWPELVESA